MSNAPMNNVVLDGAINASEWADADWNITFYLDVDNDPDFNGKINVDGNNTLYIGEDATNLYLGLDLWSDRSDNITDEWVGVWLNTANRVFDNYFDWVDYFDNGVETIVHDVELDKPWDYYSDFQGIWWLNINDDSEYIAHYGTTEGDKSNFDNITPDFNITSEIVGPDNLYWLNFSIDMKKWVYLEQELDVIEYMRIILGSRHNISINEHKLVLWNSDGTFPSLSDPDQVISLNTGTGYFEDNLRIEIGNMTIDKKLQFSLIGNHSTPFTTHIDFLRFNAFRNFTNWAGHVQVPYTTIGNYQLEWDFAPSPGNATPHRTFEFAIPKTELELYDPDEDLGIIVGGYGTLGYINGSNWWVFSEIDHHQYVQDSTYYKYYDMGGLTLPPGGIVSGYSVFLLIGIFSICSLILAKKKLK
ncbi:MAG: hypothetical protein ACW98X_05290 [Promethearchaeota archaeon]|jgi:hypothetical protein